MSNICMFGVTPMPDASSENNEVQGAQTYVDVSTKKQLGTKPVPQGKAGQSTNGSSKFGIVDSHKKKSVMFTDGPATNAAGGAGPSNLMFEKSDKSMKASFTDAPVGSAQADGKGPAPLVFKESAAEPTAPVSASTFASAPALPVQAKQEAAAAAAAPAASATLAAAAPRAAAAPAPVPAPPAKPDAVITTANPPQPQPQPQQPAPAVAASAPASSAPPPAAQPATATAAAAAAPASAPAPDASASASASAARSAALLAHLIRSTLHSFPAPEAPEAPEAPTLPELVEYTTHLPPGRSVRDYVDNTHLGFVDQYIALSTMDDISGHMSNAGRGERPELITWMIVGVRNTPREKAEVRVREILNKVSESSLPAVTADIKRVFREAAAASPEDLLATVLVTFDEIVDKSAMEANFSGLYADLTVALIRSAMTDMQAELVRFCALFVEQLVRAGEEAAFRTFKLGDLPCRLASMPDIRRRVADSPFNMMQYFFLDYVLNRNLSVEIRQGVTRNPSFMDADTDTEEKRLFKRNNRDVHLKGVVAYISELFARCSREAHEGVRQPLRLVSIRVYIMLVRYIIRRQIIKMLDAYKAATGVDHNAPDINAVAASGITARDIERQTPRYTALLGEYTAFLDPQYDRYWEGDYIDMAINILNSAAFVAEATLSAEDREYIEYALFLKFLERLSESTAVEVRIRFLIRELFRDRAQGWQSAKRRSAVKDIRITRGERGPSLRSERLRDDVKESGLLFVIGRHLGYKAGDLASAANVIMDSPDEWRAAAVEAVSYLMASRGVTDGALISAELNKFLLKCPVLAPSIVEGVVQHLVRGYTNMCTPDDGDYGHIVAFVAPYVQQQKCPFASILATGTRSLAFTHFLVHLLRRIVHDACMTVLNDDNIEWPSKARLRLYLEELFAPAPLTKQGVLGSVGQSVLLDEAFPELAATLAAEGYEFYGDAEVAASRNPCLLTPFDDYAIQTLDKVLYKGCATPEDAHQRNGRLTRLLFLAKGEADTLSDPFEHLLMNCLGLRSLHCLAVRDNPEAYATAEARRERCRQSRSGRVILGLLIQTLFSNEYRTRENKQSSVVKLDDRIVARILQEWPYATGSLQLIGAVVREVGAMRENKTLAEQRLLLFFKATVANGAVDRAILRAWYAADAKRPFGSTTAEMKKLAEYMASL